MLEPAEITDVTVRPSSFQNSAAATYFFTMCPSVPVSNNNMITIQLPVQIGANNLVCNSTTI